jgi:adhesin transport system outer membrane protein
MKYFRKILYAYTLLFATICNGQSLSLESLLEQSLATYPTILARHANKEAAKSDLLAAKLQFFPAPSVSTQRNQVTYSNQIGSSNLPSTTLTISQPLLIDGGIISGYKRADANLSAADFSILETREEVAKRLISNYAEWIKAYKKIMAIELSVKEHQKLADLITRRFDAGIASGNDKDLGISRLNQAQAELDTQKSIESTALTSISELIGYPITRNSLAGSISPAAKIPKRSEGISAALINSPMLKRLGFEAEAAESLAKQTLSQGLPQFSAQAQRQIGNAYTPGWPSYNMVGLVVSFTPGSGFSSVASAKAAFERAQSATIMVDAGKRDLQDRANADYNEYEFSLLKKNSLQQSAALSDDISASYDRQYLVGRRSWLDLLNAVRERAQTNSLLADVEGSLIGASHRIKIYVYGTAQIDGYLVDINK